MKFLADMGISPQTVAFLQTLGHDAVHLAAQGLEQLPDHDILEKARQEGRVLLVHDLGFGELVAAKGAALPSVITFRAYVHFVRQMGTTAAVHVARRSCQSVR